MMPPTYAVIGATGNCGSALLDILLKSPDKQIHAYCRNKPKLLKLMPIAAEDKRVKIFEGRVDLMVQVVRGCQTIFLVASTNTNIPGCRIAIDAAQTVVAALQQLRTDAGNTPVIMPKILVLSSASLDEYLSRKTPKLLHWILSRSASFVYEDLRIQENFLRAQEDWLTTIFIKPGGLAVDRQRGHKLNLEEEETFVSYLDVSAAMIEAADDSSNIYDMKNVSVTNTGGKAAFPLSTVACLFFGMLQHLVPQLHPYLPNAGP